MGVGSLTIKPNSISLEKAADHAYSLLENSRTENPYLTPIFETLTTINNIAVDFIRNYPDLLIPGDHPILLTGICVLTISFSGYITATCISYYVLYLFASSLQKQFPVLDSYSEKMGQLIEQTITFHPTQVEKLAQAIYEEKSSTLRAEEMLKEEESSSELRKIHLRLDQAKMRQLFFEIVVQAICKKMETASLTSRFIYEVRNQDKVTGYLIGTHHKHNWNVAHDPIFLKTLDLCGLLFTEVTEFGSDSLSGPYQYAVDRALSAHAQEKNIPNQALDSRGLWARAELEAAKVAPPDKKTLEKIYTMPEFRNNTSACFTLDEATFRVLYTRYSYLTGHAERFISDHKIADLIIPDKQIELQQRNLGWLNGEPQLLERLKGDRVEPNTDKPLCVAVGAFHLWGKNGIIPLLENAGLTLTRLPNGPFAASPA